MTRRLLSLTLASLISLLSPSIVGGQALERVPPPIDVRVTAVSATDPAAATVPLVPRGATVNISGTTVPIGSKGTQVRIEVKPPTGVVATLNAPIGVDRSWSATFSGTDVPGKYGVSAFTADGKNSATTSFTVLSDEDIDALGDMLEKELSRQAADATAALQGARAALSAKGPFPEQDAVMMRLGEVDAALAELPVRLHAARESLAGLSQIARKYPAGAHELEPITSAIQAGAARAGETTGRVRQAGAAAGKTLGVCDRIDAVNELLSAASLWFDIQGLLYQKIVQLATDKFLPDRIYNAAVPAASRDSTEKFALGESLKGVASAFGGVPAGGMAAASGGLVDFVKKPQNLLLDTAQMLTGMAFDKLCERFTGPVTGTFAVDATINGGQKFWGYTTQLTGTITLMYEKQLVKGNEPVPLTGEIEGFGSFRMYEDLMAFNPFNRRFVIYRTLVPPIGTGSGMQGTLDSLGKVARMAGPGYFRVPVTGMLQGNELTITVGESADNDFSDAIKGRAIYVVLAPAAPIPYTMASSIPVQKAQFILSRGLRTTAVLPVATTTHSKKIRKTASKSFDRTEVVSNGEVTVTWKLYVKACNPDCR